MPENEITATPEPHDNPDVSRFVVRVDSFARDGEPGTAPDVANVELALSVVLNAAGNTLGLLYHVEVEERLGVIVNIAAASVLAWIYLDYGFGAACGALLLFLVGHLSDKEVA